MNKKYASAAFTLAAAALASAVATPVRAKGEPTTLPTTLAVPATQPAKVAPDHVIMTIGDQKITAGEFDAFISTLPPRDQAMARGPYRRAWADSFLKMKLLSAEAQKRSLDSAPLVQKQLTLIRDQVLANALVSDVQEKVDDATLRKYFEDHKSDLERVAARHILIRTPGSKVPLQPGQKELTEEQAKAKADDIYKRLTSGKEDFAKLARESSDDTGSGADGGDLGSFGRGRMVAPFEQVAFALKEGDIAPPFKSPFGWHIVQVTGRFDTYDKLADVVRQTVGPSRLQNLIKDLRKNAKVELDEAYLGPPMPELEGPPGAE